MLVLALVCGPAVQGLLYLSVYKPYAVSPLHGTP